jgi:cytochrome c-type biogenesis protein CcmE
MPFLHGTSVLTDKEEAWQPSEIPEQMQKEEDRMEVVGSSSCEA